MPNPALPTNMALLGSRLELRQTQADRHTGFNTVDVAFETLSDVLLRIFTGGLGCNMAVFSILALALSALFAGAALYITLVEHPARLCLDDASLLAQWQPSYQRALPIQAGLAVLGGCAGIAAWYSSGDWSWLAGSLILLANWPFTLLVVKPVNKRLQATRSSEAGAESRALLIRWGNLHNFRSAFGLLATAVFGWSLLAAW